MSARVHHRVGGKIVRQIRVIRTSVEGKLENPHAWQMELVAKCVYVRCDHSQVFRDEGQGAQPFLRRAEEIGGTVECVSPLASGGGARFLVRFRSLGETAGATANRLPTQVSAD